MIRHLALAASALTLLAGSAHAQCKPPATAAAPAMPAKPAVATSGGATMTDQAVAASATAPAASSNASAVVMVSTVTNGPVADTRANRAKYGQPLSRAGRRTAAKGN